MGNKLLYITMVLVWALLLDGCATSSSSQSQGSQSSPPSSSGSAGASPSIPSAGGIPGSQSPSQPSQGQTDAGSESEGDSESDGDSESEAGGDSEEAGASASEDIPLEESEGDMAGRDEGLEGMSVEDAASDAVLEEALEVFDTSDVGTPGGESGAESGQDVMLEDTGSASEGSEAGAGGDMAGEGGSRPGTMSDAEELATLNRELDQALERFDGAILTERGAITEQDNADAGGLGGEEDDGEGEDALVAGPTGSASEAGTRGAASGNPADSGDGGAPAFPGSQRQGDYHHTASADDIPSDIPDGSDDDVVARQIREAAMAETDPELREKLWEEYRKYKEN